MRKRKHLLVIGILLAVPFLYTNSLAQKEPLPEFYGFYLVDNGKLIEFKKAQERLLLFVQGRGPEISYSGLDVKDPNVYFILYEKSMDNMITTGLQLFKLVFVKRYIWWEIDGSRREIYDINKWLVSDKVYKLKRKPVEKKQDMLILIPESSLKPGVYAINAFDMPEAYYDFSVNFDKYDLESEAVDRVREPGWDGWDKGDFYVPYGKYAPPSRSDLYSIQTIGMSYIEEGLYDKAEEAFRKAIEVKEVGTKSDQAKSYLGLGLALAYQHKFDDAVSKFKITINIASDLCETFYSLASIYSLQGNTDLAIEYLEMALNKGYKDYKFIKNDTDLDSIRGDPKYKKLMEGK